jgi:hypothetical protein
VQRLARRGTQAAPADVGRRNEEGGNLPKPSENTTDYFLYAERSQAATQYPEHTERGGKWLIFVPKDEIDAVWEKVAVATREGKLGSRSKVSTNRPNPRTIDSGVGVICVYTYDWEDKEDVMTIREALRGIGITQKLPYKADEDTHAGRYQVTGHTRISKYFV